MKNAKAALLWLSYGICRAGGSVPVQEGTDERKAGTDPGRQLQRYLFLLKEGPEYG